MMSGSILYPSHDPQNDFAVLFIETSGCLPMCGHGTIGTITIAIEEGLIIPKTHGTSEWRRRLVLLISLQTEKERR
jgi:4-hydroxyproline epimerase